MKVAIAVPLLRDKVLAKIRKALLEAFGGNLQQLIVGGAALDGCYCRVGRVDAEFHAVHRFTAGSRPLAGPGRVAYQRGPLGAYLGPRANGGYSSASTVSIFSSQETQC